MGRRTKLHSTGFGYIGFGNSQSNFNQRTSTPLSVYKEKLDSEVHLHYEMEFLHIDLSKKEKQKIKDKKNAYYLLELPLLVLSVFLMLPT